MIGNETGDYLDYTEMDLMDLMDLDTVKLLVREKIVWLNQEIHIENIGT